MKKILIEVTEDALGSLREIAGIYRLRSATAAALMLVTTGILEHKSKPKTPKKK